MSSRRPIQRTRSRGNISQEIKVTLKNSINTIQEAHHVKMMMYGRTGAGTTFGALDILKDKNLTGDVIYLNTDLAQNLKDNVLLLPENLQSRLIVPRDENGEYMIIDSEEKMRAVKSALEAEYGDFSSCAGIVFDYANRFYDALIEKYDPTIPIKYRKPNEVLRELCWDFVMGANTNSIIISKEKEIYQEDMDNPSIQTGSGEYESMFRGSKADWLTDCNLIIYRETRFRDDRMKRKFVSIFEKHKLGMTAFEYDDPNGNMWTNIMEFYAKKQKEIREQN